MRIHLLNSHNLILILNDDDDDGDDWPILIQTIQIFLTKEHPMRIHLVKSHNLIPTLDDDYDDYLPFLSRPSRFSSPKSIP